jgi:hypothetical protein
MNRHFVLVAVLSLAASISTSAFAGGYGNDPTRADQPQAQVPNGDAGKPGGHGGGGFGESQEGDNPSGTNGNQSKNGKTKNDHSGNAGGPGDGTIPE